MAFFFEQCADNATEEWIREVMSERCVEPDQGAVPAAKGSSTEGRRRRALLVVVVVVLSILTLGALPAAASPSPVGPPAKPGEPPMGSNPSLAELRLTAAKEKGVPRPKARPAIPAPAHPGRGENRAPANTVTGVPSGGSIVYVYNDNVWITSTDGSTQRQLTTDGTASSPYRSPSESDDGKVIVAVKQILFSNGGFQSANLVEINSHGVALRQAFAPDQYQAGGQSGCTGAPLMVIPWGLSAVASPDGTKIVVNISAYYFNAAIGDCGGLYETVNYVMNVDGSGITGNIVPKDTSVASLAFTTPTWASNTRILVNYFITGFIYYYDLGSPGAIAWFGSSGPGDYIYNSPSQRAGLLATAGVGISQGTPDLPIQVWSTNGGPPTLPSGRCDINVPRNSSVATPVPSLAPDGRSLVWVAYNTSASDPPAGLYISAIGHINPGGDCQGFNIQPLVAGGGDPYWSAAPAPPSIMAYMTNPFDGETNVDTTQPFTWTTVPGAQAYWLRIGTTRYAADLLNTGPLPSTQSTLAVAALPAGPTLYATLFTQTNGNWNRFQAITFTAAPPGRALTLPSPRQTDKVDVAPRTTPRN